MINFEELANAVNPNPGQTLKAAPTPPPGGRAALYLKCALAFELMPYKVLLKRGKSIA